MAHSTDFCLHISVCADFGMLSQGYLPREYECLNSKYGTEAELRACIKALHAHGVKAMADIVLNHRCAGKQVGDGSFSALHATPFLEN